MSSRQIPTIRPFEDSDIPLLGQWLRKEYILNWYHDADEWLGEVRERNGAFGFLHHYIVLAGDRPVGFCQWYDCFDAREEWYAVERPGEMFSLDYLIGEEDFLRKGYGTQIVGMMLDEIRKCSPGAVVVAEPDSENIASCRALLANGFVFDEEKKYFVL
jgi:RimJ/RimL family protein N-acetyltransferase